MSIDRHVFENWASLRFFYAAVIDRWVDGDTVDVIISLGFNIYIEQRLRLYGINAPEVNRRNQRAAGLAATQFCEELAPEGEDVMIRTIRDKTGKFGRYLADVVTKDGTSVVDALVRAGHAERVEY